MTDLAGNYFLFADHLSSSTLGEVNVNCDYEVVEGHHMFDDPEPATLVVRQKFYAHEWVSVLEAAEYADLEFLHFNKDGHPVFK